LASCAWLATRWREEKRRRIMERHSHGHRGPRRHGVRFAMWQWFLITEAPIVGLALLVYLL
jgi:hypothetical protein